MLTLCRGQIVYAVPAHLQQKQMISEVKLRLYGVTKRFSKAEMYINQIGEPRSGRPCLFRGPTTNNVPTPLFAHTAPDSMPNVMNANPT